MIEFDVYDVDGWDKNDDVGVAKVKLGDFLGKEKTVALVGGKGGKIVVEAKKEKLGGNYGLQQYVKKEEMDKAIYALGMEFEAKLSKITNKLDGMKKALSSD